MLDLGLRAGVIVADRCGIQLQVLPVSCPKWWFAAASMNGSMRLFVNFQTVLSTSRAFLRALECFVVYNHRGSFLRRLKMERDVIYATLVFFGMTLNILIKKILTLHKISNSFIFFKI